MTSKTYTFDNSGVAQKVWIYTLTYQY